MGKGVKKGEGREREDPGGGGRGTEREAVFSCVRV